MVGEFKLETKKEDKFSVFYTHGYINNVGGQRIVDEFFEHKENGACNFIFNLAESKMVNSIGISFLIEVIEKLNDTSGKLIFTNLDPTVEKTFTIMGLFQFADKAVDEEEAVKLIK